MTDAPAAGWHDWSLNDYLTAPGLEPPFLSGSANTLLNQSPRHAFYGHPRLCQTSFEPDAPTRDMSFGSALHSVFLENSFDPVVSIIADDYRTKAAREERDTALCAGKIPLLVSDYDKLSTVVSAARDALANSELAGVLDGAKIERSALWQDGDVWCLARPDAVSADSKIIVNYKTTAACAEPNSFGRGVIMRSGYHVQAHHHIRAVETLDGVTPRYVWIVQETSPPYAMSFIGMGASLAALAEDQWHFALALWRGCLRSNDWPSYPSRIAWIDAPDWALNQWSTRGQVPERGNDSGIMDAMERIGGFVV